MSYKQTNSDIMFSFFLFYPSQLKYKRAKREKRMVKCLTSLHKVHRTDKYRIYTQATFGVGAINLGH